MLQQKTFTLGDGEVTIQSLPATKALILLAKLTRIIGGLGRGMKDLPGSVKELKEALNSGVLNPGEMVNGLLDKLDPEQAPAMLKAMVRDSLIQPQFQKGPGFDDWYEGKFSGPGLVELMQIAKAIIEINYGDAMVWLGKSIGEALTKAAPQQTSGSPAPLMPS